MYEDRVNPQNRYSIRKKQVEEAMKLVPSKDEIIERYGTHNFDPNPVGVVYGLQNLESGRWYIGQTIAGISSNSGNFRRYPTGWIQQHWANPVVREDLNNYGWGSFGDIVVLSIGYSREELDDLEAYWIKEKDSILNGYNLSIPNKPSRKRNAPKKNS